MLGPQLPKFDPSAIQLKKSSPASSNEPSPSVPPAKVPLFDPSKVLLKKSAPPPMKPAEQPTTAQTDFRSVLKKSEK